MVQLKRQGYYAAQLVQQCYWIGLSSLAVKCINDKLEAANAGEVVHEVDAAAR